MNRLKKCLVGLLAFSMILSGCAKTGKAINNRTSVIDPFCEVQTNGIDPDQAKSVNVKKPGSLSSDFQVLTKVIIQYC